MTTANVITGNIPTLYEALNRVSREMVGMIPAVTRNTKADRAALNQVVMVPIGVSGPLEDITPGQLPADTGNTTLTDAQVVITKSKAAPIVWNGEQTMAVGSTGTYNSILADQLEDGMRKLVNAMEIDLCAAGVAGASRAVGTAGTTPFGTAADMSDWANAKRVLEDNGAPQTDLQMALNSAAMANFRGKQSQLFKVNEAGSSDMLRNGFTDRVQGFAMRNSAGFVSHAAGSGTGYLVNGAGMVVGTVAVTTDTGTGTILAADIITVAGDVNKYVVAQALAAGTVTIALPGVRGATLADNAAITVGGAYTPNLAFARSSIVLACRAPALPKGGDSAIDRMQIVDPFSGLGFEISVYAGYRQVKWEVAMAWGVSVIKPEHVVILLG